VIPLIYGTLVANVQTQKMDEVTGGVTEGERGTSRRSVPPKALVLKAWSPASGAIGCDRIMKVLTSPMALSIDEFIAERAVGSWSLVRGSRLVVGSCL
jgi:hypothetical protein